MNMESNFDFGKEWYEIWMKQSQAFFEATDKNLKEMMQDGAFQKPEEHLKQINHWLDILKNQWEFAQITDEQKALQAYWHLLSKMTNDASQKMIAEWIKRSREQKPINSSRDLYEMWLNACHEVYQQTLHTHAYQEAYAELMNASMKLWKLTVQR